MQLQSLVVTVVRWTARTLALTTFAFWAWFFGYQIKNWALNPWPLAPPVSLWIGYTLFVLFMAGLLVGLRQQAAGGLLVIAAAVPLFATTVPLFLPLAMLPGILFLACSLGQQWLDTQPVTCAIDQPVQSGRTAA